MAEKVKVAEQILETESHGNGTSPEAAIKPRKRKPRRRRRRQSHAAPPSRMAKPIDRPFPRVTLEDALKIATTIKDKNGGNPYASEDVAAALKIGHRSTIFREDREEFGSAVALIKDALLLMPSRETVHASHLRLRFPERPPASGAAREVRVAPGAWPLT